MLRFLCIIFALFVFFNTLDGIFNDNLSGIGSGRGIDNRMISFKNNPVEFIVIIITRLGALIALFVIFRRNQEDD